MKNHELKKNYVNGSATEPEHVQDAGSSWSDLHAGAASHLMQEPTTAGPGKPLSPFAQMLWRNLNKRRSKEF